MTRTYPIDRVASNYDEDDIEKSETERDHTKDSKLIGCITGVGDVEEVVVLNPTVLTLHYGH